MEVSKLTFLTILISTACYFPDYAEAFRCIKATNEIRKKEGKPPIYHDDNLASAAKNHNDYMITNNCYQHRCPGEKSLKYRATLAGYDYVTIAENIGGFQAELMDCTRAVQAWMKIPEYRANLLGDFNDFGCAHAPCKNCNRKYYITCVYGTKN